MYPHQVTFPRLFGSLQPEAQRKIWVKLADDHHSYTTHMETPLLVIFTWRILLGIPRLYNISQVLKI